MACSFPLFGYRQKDAVDRRFRFAKRSGCSPVDWIRDCPPDQERALIPCGQCLDCRLSYSRHWADRICLEASLYPPGSCWFVTLTYDDESIRSLSRSGNLYSLPKSDFTDFMKRLRSRCDYDGLPSPRFYACGEYGDTTLRPHFHACLFNLLLPDRVFLKRNFQGDLMFNSDLLSDCWSHGFVVIEELNWSSAAYVARYCLKKQTGKNARTYEDLGILPPYVRMSRRPGIAYEFFRKNWQKIYKDEKIQLANGRLCVPPRYFDNLLKGLDCDLLDDSINKRRLVADLLMRQEDIQSGVDWIERGMIKRDKELDTLAALRRFKI